MKAWAVSIDISFSAPRERSSMEDALEEHLSALMSDIGIEGPATGLNAQSHIVMTMLGVRAVDYAEALRVGVSHVQQAARSAGFELQTVERVEASAEAELATVG